jgi:hypothetical protein
MDKYHELRERGTNGANYDIMTEDIIRKLQEWEEKCEFDILAVRHDSVEIEFRALPKDLDGFTEEIYEFCPDTIEQGFGLMSEQIETLKEFGKEVPKDLLELVEGVDLEDDNSGFELLKRHLVQKSKVYLWWD